MAPHERVFPLECYLNGVNRRQGIGFKIFSVVVDRRLLKQVALAIGGGVSTSLTFLATVEEEEETALAQLNSSCAKRIESAAACFQGL